MSSWSSDPSTTAQASSLSSVGGRRKWAWSVSGWIVHTQADHVRHIKFVTKHSIDLVPPENMRSETRGHEEGAQETALLVEDVPIP
jgi:hypothetical protein